jgi:hypothetical protein
MSEIMVAIKNYTELSKNMIEKLQVATGQQDLMRAWRDGVLEKTGTYDEVYYEFHGAGIYIETDDASVEIDFLPGRLIGGFDSWRIWQMVKENGAMFPTLTSNEKINNELNALCAQGAITRVSNTNLYCLSN